MAAIKEDTSSTGSATTGPRSNSSSRYAASMVTSYPSQISSAPPITPNGDHERIETPKSPATDSCDDDGKSTSSGKWSFTRYRPDILCSPTESQSSHTTNEADDYYYTTYSIDEGSILDPGNTARVQDNLFQAESEAETARGTLATLSLLRPLTWTRDFTDSPATNEEGAKPRAEPRHWNTLQRFVSNVASEEVELARCEREVSHLAAELALLRLDFSTVAGTEDDDGSGPGGEFMSDLENGSLSLVYHGQELNEPP